MNFHTQQSYVANAISLEVLVLGVLLSVFTLTISASAGTVDEIVNISTVDRSDLNNCVLCHSQELGSAPISRNRCQSCHSEAHGVDDGKPSTFSNRGKVHIHDLHSGSEFSQRSGCSKCHVSPSCSRCHLTHSHEIKECDTCHGTLPFASGHSNEYESLSLSKHSWMNCDTCHVAGELHFKQVRFGFNESDELCGICHSKQKQSESHYEADINCTRCHNPHQTNMEQPSDLGITTNKATVTSILIGVQGIGSLIQDNIVIGLFLLILIGTIIGEKILKARK